MKDFSQCLYNWAGLTANSKCTQINKHPSQYLRLVFDLPSHLAFWLVSIIVVRFITAKVTRIFIRYKLYILHFYRERSAFLRSSKNAAYLRYNINHNILNTKLTHSFKKDTLLLRFLNLPCDDLSFGSFSSAR